MKITVPGSSSCRAQSSLAAPASMAVCRSWPQACIAPGMADAYGNPVSSVTGSASMSPRSSTTGPDPEPRPPRSTAVTELTAVPVLTSSGSPASASSTLRCVFGRSRPISGSEWIACRSSAISPASFAASSRTSTSSSSAQGPGPPYRADPPAGHQPSPRHPHAVDPPTHAVAPLAARAPLGAVAPSPPQPRGQGPLTPNARAR